MLTQIQVRRVGSAISISDIPSVIAEIIGELESVGFDVPQIQVSWDIGTKGYEVVVNGQKPGNYSKLNSGGVGGRQNREKPMGFDIPQTPDSV